MPRLKSKGEWVVAREAIVVCVGARPIEYQRRIVRDRHTGKLAEIDLHEKPPADPGDEGVPYAFKQYAKVRSDHPAVLACPGGFMPLDELGPNESAA